MNIINYDDKVAEIKMENISFHGSEEKDYLEINWQLLYGCNYRCSYCFGQEVLGKKDFPPIEILKNAVDKIFQINKTYYTFTLLGGEPTYYPHFLELIKYIYSFNKKTSIFVVSNSSRNIDYFDKLLSYVGDNDFILNFSVHFEYAQIEHIKELILLFNKYKKVINIKFMLHPEYFDKIQLYFNELIELKKDYFFNLALIELREAPDFNKVDSRYTPEFFTWIDEARKIISNIKFIVPKFKENNLFFPKNYYKVNINDNIENVSISHNLAIRNNLKTFKGFYCCGGINIIRITSKGEYKAGVCGQFPVIGNIYKDNFIDLYKLSEFVQCNINQCGCTSNDRCNKYTDINEAKEYVLNYRNKNLYLMYNSLIDNLNIINHRVSNIDNIENKIDNINDKIHNVDNKVNNIVNKLAWWIPFKKKRDSFRNNLLK